MMAGSQEELHLRQQLLFQHHQRLEAAHRQALEEQLGRQKILEEKLGRQASLEERLARHRALEEDLLKQRSKDGQTIRQHSLLHDHMEKQRSLEEASTGRHASLTRHQMERGDHDLEERAGSGRSGSPLEGTASGRQEMMEERLEREDHLKEGNVSLSGEEEEEEEEEVHVDVTGNNYYIYYSFLMRTNPWDIWLEGLYE